MGISRNINDDVTLAYLLGKNGGESGPSLQELLDVVYPVGAIYLSTVAVDPATLFGGPWERITGRFLLAATDGGSSGASQAAGNTGGEATVSHTHSMSSHTHTHSHYHGLAAGFAKLTPWSDNIIRYLERSGVSSWTSNYKINGSSYGSGSAKASTYGIGLGGTTDGASGTTTSGPSTPNTGDASDTNNMPPYLAVYVWKRTA